MIPLAKLKAVLNLIESNTNKSVNVSSSNSSVFKYLNGFFLIPYSCRNNLSSGVIGFSSGFGLVGTGLVGYDGTFWDFKLKVLV